MIREEIFEKLRGAAGKTSDLRLAVRLLAVVACITKSMADVTLALDKARWAKHKSDVAESLAIIVRVLAHAGQFIEARAIVGNKKQGITGEMVGLDPYWHAEAAIWLAEISGDKDDEAEAKATVNNIRNPGLRDEARADLSAREQHIHLPCNPIMALVVLADALDNGQAPYNSARLHGQVDEIIAKIFLSHLG